MYILDNTHNRWQIIQEQSGYDDIIVFVQYITKMINRFCVLSTVPAKEKQTDKNVSLVSRHVHVLD